MFFKKMRNKKTLEKVEEEIKTEIETVKKTRSSKRVEKSSNYVNAIMVIKRNKN